MKLVTDIIIETGNNGIILARRGTDPYKNMWGQPGGKMEDSETIEQAAIREAKEETGLDIQLQKLVGVFSAVHRDPRGRYISVVYTATICGGHLKAGSDAREVKVFNVYDHPGLAFDHQAMLDLYRRERHAGKTHIAISSH